MTSSRNLSPKHLSAIFSELLEDHDTRSLARLLRVSRDIQAITLPLLYEDPFRFFRDSLPADMDCRATEGGLSPGSDIKLVKLLLRCVSNDQVLPDWLRMAYAIHNAEPPLVNYLSYLRRMDIGLRPVGIPPDYEIISGPTSNDVTWALGFESAERLTSIMISPSDIQRYQSIIHRFTSLTQVCFHTPQISSSSAARGDSQEDLETDLRDGLETLIQFIQTHKTIGAIQDIYYPGCVQEDRKAFWESLPLMDKPKAIDDTNLDRFLATADQVDIGCIKSIRVPLIPNDIKSMQQSAPYLSRCRSLERYEAPFLGTQSDSFRFAVEEKYYREDPNKAPNGYTPLDDQNMPQMTLKHFKSRSSLANNFIPWVDEVVWAFSESLESVWAEQNVSSTHLSSDPYPTVFGGHWSLPCLRKLELRNEQADVVISTNLLSNSPLLEELTLMDYSSTVFDVDAIEEPFHLARLRILRLGGRMALTLHPASLTTSPLLETLHLDCFSYKNDLQCLQFQFQSPRDKERMMSKLEDIDIWSWNWDLPRLRSLSFFGVIASAFPFRALQLMPRLQTLYLDIGEWDENYENYQRRRFDLAELTIATADTTSVIRLPALENLHLSGRWDLDVSGLQDVFSQVMPALRCVSLLTKTFDMTKSIQATTTLEDMSYLRSGVSTSDPAEVIQGLGLVKESTKNSPFSVDDYAEIKSLRLASWWPKKAYLRQLQDRHTVHYEFVSNSSSYGTYVYSRTKGPCPTQVEP
ncbi:hypothetical protein B0O80DRAFT_441320 [Mortierella sp. GBAus27b]|nr:hypothetical protein BGX31_005884 [Mortierella sp. GBA43]KAI8358723.1 hypothetical protein B0O80DRAFT_441320 [Mortierella sp. GBAus27b]